MSVGSTLYKRFKSITLMNGIKKLDARLIGIGVAGVLVKRMLANSASESKTFKLKKGETITISTVRNNSK